MPPDSRSVSFIFHRDIMNVGNSFDISRGRKSLRRRLQDRFDDDESPGNSSLGKEKGPEKKDCSGSGRSWHNLSLGNVTSDSRKALQNGAERISKTFYNVKVTFGNISQRFKISTRRRQRLEEQFTPDIHASKSATPQTRSRQVLGRTPTKLYSPFGIESPMRAWGKENDPTESMDTSKSSKDSKRKRLFNFPKITGFRNLR